MNSDSTAFLWRLLETVSPAGFKAEATRVWHARAATFADEVSEDSNGNSYARLRGSGPRLLEGHIDEIGLLISHINVDGFCWFQPIGGWDDVVLTGQRVRILGRHGSVAGAIGRVASHLLTPEEREKAIKLKSL